MPASANYDADDFSRRHIGIAPRDVRAMLETVGVQSLDDLIAQTMPASIRQHTPLAIGAGLSESEVLRKLRRTAAKNKVAVSLIGQGYYGTVLPPVIQRNILENPAWYTAYTPYQPEISQGRLEALLNFQTMVAELTGLAIANASLLDEATAAAEAMAMAYRLGHDGKSVFFVDADCHPQTIAVVRTRAEPFGWQVVVGDPQKDLNASALFGALLQYPGSSGEIRDIPTRHFGLARGGSTGNCGCRSAGADVACAAGGNRRRHCRRLDAALRRPHGVRRPARGLYRDQG